MWNTLGLGVAASFAALGAGAMAFPHLTADVFGLRALAEGSGRADVPAVISLIGARDLSIATALFALGRAGREKEMGTVILSTMLLCAVDVYVVWRNGKYRE